jgi:hypothetical protein
VETPLIAPISLFERKESSTWQIDSRILSIVGLQIMSLSPDHPIISGDVVQNKTVPAIFREGGTPGSWLAVLDKVAKLDVRHVLPDHSPIGDCSLVTAEPSFIGDVHARALAMKRQGVKPEEAGKQVASELRGKYPDWPNLDRVADFVQPVYTESQ